MNILLVSGSQHTASFNTRLLEALPSLAPEGLDFSMLDYAKLPIFNQDLENPYPQEATAAKEQIRAADGIIIATPEHNRSMPAALKNLLDWTSRPYGENAWEGKRAYVIGATSAATGTALAQADVRKVLLYLDVLLMPQPEIYISKAHEKFSESGALADEDTKKHLRAALGRFSTFVKNVGAADEAVSPLRAQPARTGKVGPRGG